MPCPHPDDAGFSLVESVIALVLLASVMASLGVLFVGGLRHGSSLQRRQAAVGLAAQALEAARAVSAVPDSSGCVKLLQGRSKAAVDAQWAVAPSGVTTTTDEAWAASACAATTVLPLQGLPGAAGTVTDPVYLAGLAYTVRTYVGTCVVTAANDACLKQANVGGGGPTMYRIAARVTWSGTGCDTATCDYTASTLMNGSPDPVFNVRNGAAPVAAADTVCLHTAGPGTINIISNDSGSLGPTPVTVVAQPSKGTLASTITSGVGGYTPNAGASGTDTFSYYLTDVNGVLSSSVTVTITIGGC